MLEPFAFPRHTGPPQCERHSVNDCPRERQCPSMNESCPLVFDDGRPDPRLPRTWPSPLPHESLDRYWLYKASQGGTAVENLWKLLGVFPLNLHHPNIFHKILPSIHLILTPTQTVLSKPFLNILFQVSDAFKRGL